MHLIIYSFVCYKGLIIHHSNRFKMDFQEGCYKLQCPQTHFIIKTLWNLIISKWQNWIIAYLGCNPILSFLGIRSIKLHGTISNHDNDKICAIKSWCKIRPWVLVLQCCTQLQNVEFVLQCQNARFAIPSSKCALP